MPDLDAYLTSYGHFRRFRDPGLVPESSPGLEVQFPVKNAGFGCVFAALLHFSPFLKSLEMFCGFWTCFARFGSVLRVLEAQLSSRDQVAQPPRLLGESQDDGFGWRATASGLSPSNRGGCALSLIHI